MTRTRPNTAALITICGAGLVMTVVATWSLGAPLAHLPELDDTARPALAIRTATTATERRAVPGPETVAAHHTGQTLQLVHARTEKPIPGATVWFSDTLQAETDRHGRVPFTAGARPRSLAAGYYIQSLEIHEAAPDHRRATVRPALPLRGRVKRIPTDLHGHVLEVVWDYGGSEIPRRDQALAYRARWSAACAVDANGEFRWQHLFPAAGELVLRVRNRASGRCDELMRRRVAPQDHWVEFDLEGRQLSQRDALLVATLRFAPNTPTGRGQLELLDHTGSVVRFSNRTFVRRESETEKHLTIDDLVPGTYTPRILFTQHGVFRLAPLRIAGRAVADLVIPTGGRIAGRILNCGEPDLVKNPVAVHLRDMQGRICRTGYATTREGRIGMTAVAPGTYLAHATERRSGRVSKCQQIVVSSGASLAPEFVLDDAARIRMEFSDHPPRSGSITIEDEAGHAVQRTWMNHRYKRKTMRLPLGTFYVKTDFGTEPARIVVRDNTENTFPIQLSSSR